MKSVKNKRILSCAAALLTAGATVSTAAIASHDSSYREDNQADRAGFAKVIRSEPILRHVQVSTPREECSKEPVQHRAERDYTTGRTILGGIIGAAIGNQVGHGRGNDAATVAGGLAGAAIGANSAKKDRHSESYTTHETRCRTVYESHSEERVEGYDVTYLYGGETYSTRLPYEPGKRIPVHVSVTPARR